MGNNEKSCLTSDEHPWEHNALDIMSERLSQLGPDTNHTASPSLVRGILERRDDQSERHIDGQSLSINGDESTEWVLLLYYRTDVSYI